MYTLGQAVVVFAGICLALLSVMLGFSWAVRPLARRPEAEETYECGMPAEGVHRGLGFNYIGYAALFLLFDLAALYLFLYAVAPDVPMSVSVSVSLALATLCIVIIYGTQKRRYYVA